MQALTLTIALHCAADTLADRDVCDLETWLDRLDSTAPDDFRQFRKDVHMLENALVGFAIAARASTFDPPVFTTKRGVP